jgi:hypothetical protein
LHEGGNADTFWSAEGVVGGPATLFDIHLALKQRLAIWAMSLQERFEILACHIAA